MATDPKSRHYGRFRSLSDETRAGQPLPLKDRKVDVAKEEIVLRRGNPLE
jgi:hypothetical protein